MTAAVQAGAAPRVSALASDGYREGSVVDIAGFREEPSQMLEPDEGKLSSPVLRGPGRSNLTRLPDPQRFRSPTCDRCSLSF